MLKLKPINDTINAIQFDGTNINEIKRWSKMDVTMDHIDLYLDGYQVEPGDYVVNTKLDVFKIMSKEELEKEFIICQN